MLQLNPKPENLNLDDKYSHFVNPQWVKLLNTLGMNCQYVRSSGAELFTESGQTYLDFLSGYGVFNAGHHHPKINEALREELLSGRPTMLQSHVPDLAAELAEKLSRLAGGELERVFFTSTGSEGVETAIKFARKHTKRDPILYCAGGFHGLTCGALSLMSNEWWRDGFGSLLPSTVPIPFGDLEALKKALNSQRFAALILEPVQAESGIIVPSAEYLLTANELCHTTGTLFVVDEVQTGVYRTGRFLASHHYGLDPDMVIMAKAMSGGQVPVGAVLMRKDISNSVYTSIDKAFVHASTFGENALAMRAALITLQVMEDEKLGERCIAQGEQLRSKLRALQSKYSLLADVRGLGLLNGMEFRPPARGMAKMLHSAMHKAHPGAYGQLLVKAIFDYGHVLTQMCGNNYQVIKAAPPLIISDQQIDQFVGAIARVLELVEHEQVTFWREGLAMALRAFSENLGGK